MTILGRPAERRMEAIQSGVDHPNGPSTVQTDTSVSVIRLTPRGKHLPGAPVRGVSRNQAVGLVGG